MTATDIPANRIGRRNRWAWISLILAVAGTTGSLALSLAMGLKACPLCFYQRTFMMAAMSVLAVSLFSHRENPGRACFVALPLVWAGLGVAAYHEWLVLTGVLECPPGLWGIGTAPAQSLALFAALAMACSVGTSPGSPNGGSTSFPAIFVLIVFGGLLSWACVATSPPLPPVPDKPYDSETQPLDMCRPAYRVSY